MNKKPIDIPVTCKWPKLREMKADLCAWLSACDLVLLRCTWSWSRLCRTWRTCGAVWLTVCSWARRSCSRTALTWLWTHTSPWPSIPHPSCSRPNPPAWCSTSSCTRHAVTWGICVWWTPTGCRKPRRSISAGSCARPRVNAFQMLRFDVSEDCTMERKKPSIPALHLLMHIVKNHHMHQ